MSDSTNSPIPDRLRAIWDIAIPGARSVGRHEYDGQVADLSPSGIATALSRLGHGRTLSDQHDEAHLSIEEASNHFYFEDYLGHRRDPYLHIANLELADYDRPYAPAEQRDAARLRHIAAWPDAIAASLESLDSVTAPVAKALLAGVEGLAADLPDSDHPIVVAARTAHQHFVDHIQHLSTHGDPDATIGGPMLARLIGCGEGMEIDLNDLTRLAESETTRLTDFLHEACSRLDPSTPPAQLIDRLTSDHPSAQGVLTSAQQLVDEVTDFTIAHQLLPPLGGSCLVEPTPPSRMSAFAWMCSAGAYEDNTVPSLYWITPPQPSWPAAEQEEWLRAFNYTTLPAITAHEVTPGHFAHFRMLRQLTSPVRRSLCSYAFTEGWAHYAEELLVEQGFRAETPQYAIGVYIEALIRVVRLYTTLGFHTGALSLDEATATFEQKSYLQGSAARAEAERATYDPGYGAYTLGKLYVNQTRTQAQQLWGSSYSHLRFHEALLQLGAPPLGLLQDALAPA